MNSEQRPEVGVGIMIFKDKKVLMGKRKNAHGAGEYATPGGHLEYMESFEGTAIREVAEESGLEIENLKFLCLVNMKGYAPRHYVQIWFKADWKSGEPKLMEPEKCEGWDWYDLENLPQPVYKTTPYAIEAINTGKNYFDA